MEEIYKIERQLNSSLLVLNICKLVSYYTEFNKCLFFYFCDFNNEAICLLFNSTIINEKQ